MTLHVVDADEWDVARKGERFPVTDSHQQCANETRRIGNGDRVEIAEGSSRFLQRAVDDRNDAGEVRAGRDLGYHASEHAMDVLRENHEGFLRDLVASTFENRRRRFIARRLDSQNERHRYSVRSVRSLSTRARASGEFQSVADISLRLISPSLPMMNVSG